MVPAAVVWLSYGVSSSYVLADAIDKGKKAGDVSARLPLNPAIPVYSPGGSVHSLTCDKVTAVKHVGQSNPHNLARCSPYPGPICRIAHPASCPVYGIVYTPALDVDESTLALNVVQSRTTSVVCAWPPLPTPWCSLMSLVHRVSCLCFCWIKCLLCLPGTRP